MIKINQTTKRTKRTAEDVMGVVSLIASSAIFTPTQARRSKMTNVNTNTRNGISKDVYKKESILEKVARLKKQSEKSTPKKETKTEIVEIDEITWLAF